RRSASRSLEPATLFDKRALTPTTTSRLRAMAPCAKATLALLMSCNSPPGAMTPVRAMLTRQRPICGAAPCNRGNRIHIVRSARTGVTPAGRPVLAAAGMGVDVDQAWSDDLAPRIDRLNGIARDVGF